MSIVADVVVVVDNILHDYNVAGVVVADDVEPEIEDDVDGAVQLFGYGSVFAAGDDADVNVAAVAVVVDAAAAAAAAAVAVVYNIPHFRFSSFSEADSAKLSAASAPPTYSLIFSLTRHRCTTSFVL